MSERAPLLLLLGALLLPRALPAQGLAELRAERVRLARQLDSIREVEHRPPAMDTVRAPGGWTLLVSPSLRSEALRQAPPALDAAQREFGGLLDPAIPLRIEGNTLKAGKVGVKGVAIGEAEIGASYPSWTPNQIGELVQRVAGLAAWRRADTALRGWLGEGFEPSGDFSDVASVARMRLQLDTAAAIAGCRRERLDQCALALFGDPGRGRDPDFGRVVRASLAWFALERGGGTRALLRLYADPSVSILDRLAAVAGLSRMDLLREWRRAVQLEGSERPLTALSAILGALVMFLVALWGMQWRKV